MATAAWAAVASRRPRGRSVFVRILLIQPDYDTDFGFRLAAMPEPLHLEILAATVPQHEVRILDMRLDADLRGALESFAPDVVGVTALTTEVYTARDVLAGVKAFSPEIFTLIGGQHCTLMPEDFLIEPVDAAALGEGEFVFPQLIAALERDRGRLGDVPNLIWRDRDGRWVRNGRDMPRFRSMDSLPLPRRELVAQHRPEYFFLFDKPDTSVAASRGCPFHCNFCSVHEFYGGHTRQMSAARVMEDIARVPTRHVTFVDDNFLMNYKREAELAERIRAAGLDMSFSMEARTDSIARHPELLRQS
jgi:radical SAM superfamily enzyme YgiQ (UPF0313 family)